MTMKTYVYMKFINLHIKILYQKSNCYERIIKKNQKIHSLNPNIVSVSVLIIIRLNNKYQSEMSSRITVVNFASLLLPVTKKQ